MPTLSQWASTAMPQMRVLDTCGNVCITSRERLMQLSKYRVEAGVYDVGRYRIYYQGPKCWTLRDPADSIVDWFTTLRTAIRYAERLEDFHRDR